MREPSGDDGESIFLTGEPSGDENMLFILTGEPFEETMASTSWKGEPPGEHGVSDPWEPPGEHGVIDPWEPPGEHGVPDPWLDFTGDPMRGESSCWGVVLSGVLPNEYYINQKIYSNKYNQLWIVMYGKFK